MFIPDPYLDFFPIPDPGSRGQKAPDFGSASATLIYSRVTQIREQNIKILAKLP
jgi:hypothetical protein